VFYLNRTDSANASMFPFIQKQHRDRRENVRDGHRNDRRGNQSHDDQVGNHDQVGDHWDHRCV